MTTRWRTTVEGLTNDEIVDAAEAAIRAFFGIGHDYSLNIHPHIELTNAGQKQRVFIYEADVEVEL